MDVSGDTVLTDAEPIRIEIVRDSPFGTFSVTPPPSMPDDPIRLLPGRAERRREQKKACCALCNKPLGSDRMPWRLPDPRPGNWGLMATGHAHPRCAAEAYRRAYEATKEALDRMAAAAKKYMADHNTEGLAAEVGLWTPSQGAPR